MGKVSIALALTLFGGWAVPRCVHAQHEWDNFGIGECLILNVTDTIPKLETVPSKIPGQNYTCQIDGGVDGLILTDPKTGQMQYLNRNNRELEPVVGGYGVAGSPCPVPGDDSAWFLLNGSLGSVKEGGTQGGKLDMRADSGLGAITSKMTFLPAGNNNPTTIVPAADHFHYWLITLGGYVVDSRRGIVPTTFNSYLIGPDGPMDAPVVSNVPVDLSPTFVLHGSPNGMTIVGDAQYDSLQGVGTGIFHFDPLTGRVTLIHVIQPEAFPFPHYSSFSPWAFSPNGTLLYTTGFTTDSISYLLQYDLTRLDQSDAPYIVALSKDTDYHAFGVDIALTGNGRIYGVSNYWRPDKQGIPIGYWYSIDSPDSLGAACHFEDTAFSVGYTEGDGIYNPIPRVVHSTLTQISAALLPTCQSTGYSFYRPDTGGFPHWTFEGGSPASASGPVVPEVLFDSAGAHEVFAITSTGDTLFTIVVGGVQSGAAVPTKSTYVTVRPDTTVILPVQLMLNYANGGDSIGHLMQEYAIQFDSSVLSLPSSPAQAISLPVQDELVSARAVGGMLMLVVQDTLYHSWRNNSGVWRDTMDAFTIRFNVTKADNWQSTKVTLVRFSIDDGFGTRYDFCPQENNLLATITNANAGVTQPSALDNVTLYPNPTTGVVTISGASGAVVVENVLGERVLGGNSTGTTPQPPPLPLRSRGGGESLDLSGLPAGTYFVRVETAGGIVVKRIIKE